VKLAILYFPLEVPVVIKKGVLGRTLRKFCGLSKERRNPRDESYMRRLASSELGDSATVKHISEFSEQDLEYASEIVLLWPDGNGYGWFQLERRFLNLSRQRNIPLGVLNGRRRMFRVSGSKLIPYWINRNVERFWIGEAVFLAVFLATTPILLAWDWSRGHR
jgi:hypothetical protein